MREKTNANAPSGPLDQLDDETFRHTIRTWIEATYPRERRFPAKRLHRAESRFWYDALAARGWIAPGWPSEFGGMGLGAGKQIIFQDELDRFGCTRINDLGINMIGPLLISRGTQAQRDGFLPGILSGEHIWCQGYSEPGSGSDLASLRTRAERVPGGWMLRGQKTWTTLANDANWIFVLARTDPDAKPQRGIGFFLVPMDGPGVTVRPILTLDLHDEFCDTFLDDVFVPDEHVVGDPREGWSIAKALLGFERIFLGSPKQSAFALNMLGCLADRMALWDDAGFREAYDRLRLDLEDHRIFFEDCANRLRLGQGVDHDISRLKIHQSELFQRITEAALDFAGQDGTVLGSLGEGLDPGSQFLQARAATIYGGSSQIQRDILAKQALGLPL